MISDYVQSIRGKTILFFILPVTLLVGIGLNIWYQQSLNYAISLAKNNLSQTTQTIAATINEDNELATRTAKVMALAQQNGLFGKRIESTQYARDVLNMSTNLVGAYFGYEENADGQDHVYKPTNVTAALTSHDKNGRYIPYWYRGFDDNTRLILEPLMDMATSLYYAGVRDLYLSSGQPQSMITEPYVYQGRMIVEQTFPIIIDGQFKGIAGVDRALDDIELLIRHLKQRFHVDIYLISRMQRFIASTVENDALKTLLVKDTDYQGVVDQIVESSESVILRADPYDDSLNFFDVALIESGNWYVLVRRSKSDVVAPIKQRFEPLVFYSILGLLIIFIFSLYFSYSISNRISTAVLSLKKLTEGDLDFKLNEVKHSRDEVDIMFKSFDQLVQANREIDTVCSHIAAGRFDIKMHKRGPKDTLSDSINSMSKKRQYAEEALRDQAEQLRQTQKDLIEAEKMASLTTLVSGIAHEINTPLGVGVTIASHIQEHIKLVDQKMSHNLLTKNEFEMTVKDLEESCDILLKNMNRAAKLIASFKKISVDQNMKDVQSIKLTEYLDSLLMGLSHELKKASVDIDVISSPNEPNIKTDPGALAQIFTNLIMNSIIHGFGEQTAAGRIRIAISYSKNNVNVVYIDSGKGVERDALGKIFDPFYTTNRQYGGSGLGLNIVYNLVTQRLGGSINADARLAGGILFKIKWPKNIDQTRDQVFVKAISDR